MKKILLGITGSISAYKAAHLTSRLTKMGYQVDTIMTKNNVKIITPLTIQSLSRRRVHTDLMEESEPEKITHIDLAQSTDLFLVAPASANIIGKLASGVTDDLLTSVAVALHSNTPKILAPAMNSCMYENSIVQRNLALLKENGFQEIQPRESILSSGSFGKGALAEVSDIVGVVENTLK